jgi:hypothetical protein
MHIQGRKGGGGSAHTPVEAPDDLLSTAKLKMLAIAEGEIQGELTAQQIFSMIRRWLTLTAVTISGVVWDWRRGNAGSDVHSGMPEIDNELAVGVTVTVSTLDPPVYKPDTGRSSHQISLPSSTSTKTMATWWVPLRLTQLICPLTVVPIRPWLMRRLTVKPPPNTSAITVLICQKPPPDGLFVSDGSQRIRLTQS